MDKNILVLGDLSRHRILRPCVSDPSESRESKAAEGKYLHYLQSTGASSLQSMICHALVEFPGALPVNEKKKVDEEIRRLKEICKPGLSSGVKPGDEDARVAETVHVLDYFPVGSSAGKSNETVLRVKSTYEEHVEKAQSGAATEGELTGVNPILVIYDCDFTFRCEKNLIRLIALREKALGGAVIGIRDSVRDWVDQFNKLDSEIQASSKTKEFKDRTVILVSVDDLRKSGLDITQNGTFEQAVQEISRYQTSDPLKTLFDLASHLILIFRETGALYLTTIARLECSIHICPNFDRRAQAYRSEYGFVPGKFTTFLSAVVKELFHAEKPDAWDLARSIRLGTIAHNCSFTQGLNNRLDIYVTNPLEAIEMALSWKRRLQLQKFLEDGKEEYLLSSMTFQAAAAPNWQRTEFYKENEQICRDIVRLGIKRRIPLPKEDEKNKSFPWTTINCPYAQFGRVRLISHEEIQNFSVIHGLISKYLDSPTWNLPVSIAVFGEPGGGKSFAVKQILKSVRPDYTGEPLTINLAQFGSVEQLMEAFHGVQDKALASKEVPLVIFDEFDSDFDGEEFGWLKYFLAPMQDGLFRENRRTTVSEKSYFCSRAACRITSTSFEIISKKIRPRAPRRARRVQAPPQLRKNDVSFPIFSVDCAGT